jgi:hypothetical protein
MDNFRTIDRGTGYLLPPSVDEWMPEKHLARFIVEVIDGLGLSGMSRVYRGSGSASYRPGMLLGQSPHHARRPQPLPRRLVEAQRRQHFARMLPQPRRRPLRDHS